MVKDPVGEQLVNRTFIQILNLPITLSDLYFNKYYRRPIHLLPSCEPAQHVKQERHRSPLSADGFSTFAYYNLFLSFSGISLYSLRLPLLIGPLRLTSTIIIPVSFENNEERLAPGVLGVVSPYVKIETFENDRFFKCGTGRYVIVCFGDSRLGDSSHSLFHMINNSRWHVVKCDMLRDRRVACGRILENNYFCCCSCWCHCKLVYIQDYLLIVFIVVFHDCVCWELLDALMLDALVRFYDTYPRRSE